MVKRFAKIVRERVKSKYYYFYVLYIIIYCR